MNVKMKNLFPSLKSRHTFFGFHRVYGMQNDRLNLTVILAETSKNYVQGNRFFIFTFMDFSKKIYEIFFHKWGMPWGYVELVTN